MHLLKQQLPILNSSKHSMTEADGSVIIGYWMKDQQDLISGHQGFLYKNHLAVETFQSGTKWWTNLPT